MDEITDGVGKIDFHHPYTPYDVQEEFMSTVYEVLEQGEGQVGILESPTGTGKSLSLICAALTWLRNHKRSKFESSIAEAAKEFKDEPDWIINQMLKRKRGEMLKQWEEREARLKKIRAKEKQLEERGAKRRRLEDGGIRKSDKATDDEDEWLLDEGQDDDASQGNDNSSGYSKETRALMGKLGMGTLQAKEEEDDIGGNEVKIYYTSRTHSQLTQFISELRRPTFPASLPGSLKGDDHDSESEDIKHLPLSSRQRLCINPSVSRLSSLAAINDRCSELQQSKSKDRCQFVPNADNLNLTHQFRDNALATLPDIEDLFELGKKLHVCPYYASRTAVPGAEIITLPYPLLLQKTARDALGIKLEGNVVIIDEAHNIMDAVANVYASEVSLSELKRARQMLGVYVKKFGKKLKGENRVMVGQVARVVDGLRDWLENALALKNEQGIVDPNSLLRSKGIDQINMYKLIQYIQDSKLAYKIEGYVVQAESQGTENNSVKVSSTPVLHTLLSFLVSLNNLSSEGRIFYHKVSQSDVKLSYLLLSPTHAFSSVASSARAVILAGGTMSPFEDYTAHLFPDLAKAKITTLSCGHVIPTSNLCVWTLASSGPKQDARSTEFEFSFQKRSDKSMIRDLGIAILNICTAVPDGVVVFFPSYGYLDEVVATWNETSAGQTQSLWDKLQTKKAAFRETKGGSSDEVLEQYTHAILGDGYEAESNTKKRHPASGRSGALLLSVVGGKMSEGINFSDRLGRCVVVIGLPYPNIHSPDWKARIEYIESTTLARLKAISKNPSVPRTEDIAASKQAARDFYENACMRAVNQSIGRAIRHRNDYAAIILVDRRFGTDRIKGKLPGWIRGGLVEGSERAGLGQMMGKLTGFFRGKKNEILA
ncbi:DNA repair helicase [Annulohypoxylon maeteangense]|uniref:DNA repair helicase n=1 Tax=Annulohypoxylon maeteangense TaxID=1927788 RepID=UPI0020075976|nr:DNA repair helicase [Annulohypoxylon maeteangense]KAI0880886.1 DNA repair helicase [Annulohypoxylon maeteangense]